MRVIQHTSDEKTILLGLIEGSEQAFEKIYRLYSPRLFSRLLQLVKLESQAEEILQDIFLKIWEQRKSIDPEKSFPSFLFKIAENKVYDFFRTVTRDKNMESQLTVLTTANTVPFMSDEENRLRSQGSI